MSFSHHKDALVGPETAVEFLNDCRVEGTLVLVHGRQGVHLECGSEDGPYTTPHTYIQYIDVCVYLCECMNA